LTRIPAFLTALLLSSGAFAMMKPRVVETRFPTDDIVIASIVIDAPKDGVADATPAIQSAIDEAAAAGGGVVFLPAGKYRLAGRLTIKEGVTLRGDWDNPTLPKVPIPSGGYSILMPTADKGNADGPPAITMERGTGLREMTIWYPDQDFRKIEPYPWTIRASDKATGDNITIQNVALINPYQAIKIGPEWNELHTIRNVYGSPLKAGIWLDTCTDIGRLTEVRFSWLWWSQSKLPGAPTTEAEGKVLREFTRNEGIGVEMRRSDWEYLDRVHIEGYRTGFVIRPGAQGTANAVMFGCLGMECSTALRLEGLNEVGLSVTGGCLDGEASAIEAPPSFASTAQINACELNAEGPVVLAEGPGTLTFQNCAFTGSLGKAVSFRRGQVSSLGCTFQGPRLRLELAPGVQRARVLGNRFGDGSSVENSSSGDVEIAHHGVPFAKLETVRHPDAAHPRPADKALFVVSDFGAAPGEKDNTAAFAKALDAARKAGGGTVYVPAGNYRFEGQIVVPTGVELRGIFDVPHHTVSGGSVLMTTANKGKADAMPFIRLETKSGLRGLTIWYPDQDLRQIAPYPWAIQSLGPRCWLKDVTLGNAYQGADFWTYPSDGHVISYLAGAVFKRGLFVSKCKGDGWVEDVQFNPHYCVRIHPSLTSRGFGNPREVTEKDIGAVIDYQRANLEGIVFGRCENEHVARTFLYAAYDGIAFRDDPIGAAAGLSSRAPGNGTVGQADRGTKAERFGAKARVIIHGTDTGSRCAVLEGSAEVEFINAQLVPYGPHEKGAIIVADSFKGKVSFFNTQIWAGSVSGVIGGSGDVLIQGVNTLSGPFVLKGGRVTLENAHFTRDLKPHVRVEPGVESARLIANLAPGEFRIERVPSRGVPKDPSRGLPRPREGKEEDTLPRDRNPREGVLYARANSLDIPPAASRFTFKTSFEEGDPQPLANTLATQGGGLKNVSKAECRVAETDAHTGKRALRLSGNADDPAYSYVYFKVFEEPLGVQPDSVLSYWIRPMNERGRCTGIDLLFADGTTLRDSQAKSSDGMGVHPGNPKGTVGQWAKVSIPLGQYHAGKVISAIFFAYDSRGGGGPFEAWFDDVALESAQGALPFVVTAKPAGGGHKAPLSVELHSPDGAPILYSLDGLSPTADSPRYEKPVVLDKPGLWELRFRAESKDGRLGRVSAELYDIE